MVFTGRVGVEDECDFADCTMIIFKRFPVTENISKTSQNASELGMRIWRGKLGSEKIHQRGLVSFTDKIGPSGAGKAPKKSPFCRGGETGTGAFGSHASAHPWWARPPRQNAFLVTPHGNAFYVGTILRSKFPGLG